ncbi:hypothetical protein ACLKA7_003353 [Drosophila subpalustris]
MLLPDQTYADYVARHLTKPRSKSSSTTITTNSYDRTADFFENIPDFVGASLPTFLYTPQSVALPDVPESPSASSSSPSGQAVEEQQQGISSGSEENCDDVLRLCEDFLCRHRMRPDFFCQYHKAVSSTTPSPKQSKASPVVDTGASASGELKSSKDQDSSMQSGSKVTAVVERFTKFSAIYTLPVAKRKKTCNKTTGNITGKL